MCYYHFSIKMNISISSLLLSFPYHDQYFNIVIIVTPLCYDRVNCHYQGFTSGTWGDRVCWVVELLRKQAIILASQEDIFILTPSVTWAKVRCRISMNIFVFFRPKIKSDQVILNAPPPPPNAWSLIMIVYAFSVSPLVSEREATQLSVRR